MRRPACFAGRRQLWYAEHVSADAVGHAGESTIPCTAAPCLLRSPGGRTFDKKWYHQSCLVLCLALMVGGLGGEHAPVRCMGRKIGPGSDAASSTRGDWRDGSAASGHENLPVASSPSSSSGLGWTAASAQEMADRQRVAHWREMHGAQEDSDFAYMFCSLEQAITLAGHAVADSWLETRHRDRDAQLQAMDQVVQDAAPKPSARQPPVVTKVKVRRQRARLRENTSERPEAVVERVAALQQVWLAAGALRPEGRMSDEVQRAWEKTCNRLAQQQVTQAEPVTITNALRTFAELRKSMASQGRQLPPATVDLDHYLYEGTSAPGRALASLRWLSNQGDLHWPLHRLVPPPQNKPSKKSGQASVV